MEPDIPFGMLTFCSGTSGRSQWHASEIRMDNRLFVLTDAFASVKLAYHYGKGMKSFYYYVA